jgi:hypothetical protein
LPKYALQTPLLSRLAALSSPLASPSSLALYLPMLQNILIGVLCVVVLGMLGMIMIRFLKKLEVIEKERWGEKAKEEDTSEGFLATILPFLRKKK